MQTSSGLVEEGVADEPQEDTASKLATQSTMSSPSITWLCQRQAAIVPKLHRFGSISRHVFVLP